MADQEIAKHTKQVLAVVSSKEHKGWHKLREMLLEMVTIVFAVTLSMWLHSWGEHRHEQKQVKAFLVGLRTDLQSDIKQMKSVIASQRTFDANYTYLAALDPAGTPDARFKAVYETVSNNAFLVPQVSRYEGFKTSGKLTNIENPVLLDSIVNLYQFDIPKLNLSFGGWSGRHSNLVAYLEDKMDDADTPAARYKLITSPKGKRLAAMVKAHPQLYERYDLFVQHATAIIAEIDKA
jgi:hypothetical protein